jgi:hypothetical protein
VLPKVNVERIHHQERTLVLWVLLVPELQAIVHRPVDSGDRHPLLDDGLVHPEEEGLVPVQELAYGAALAKYQLTQVKGGARWVHT